jgi:hypothetical protein
MSDDDRNPLTASLEAIQGFTPSTIARTEALGSMFDFTPAVPVVTQVVDYFRLIPKDLVPSLPDGPRNQVQNQADACWGPIQQMMQFAPTNVDNPANARQSLINQLNSQFGDAIGQLGPVVAYLSARLRTSSGAEAEARALLETAKERVEEMGRLERETTEASKRLLGEVRHLASEAGVSQQATYFGDQAGKHATAAGDWQKYTNRTAAALVIFALATWIAGIWLVPENNYQAIQFGISKLLIFSTIAFTLFLCARTLMAHRHNEVVNRHRQNALLTFNALAEAAATPETKDVVLTHASACIYAPQESGFSKTTGTPPSPSLVEVIPRIMGGAHGTGA